MGVLTLYDWANRLVQDFLHDVRLSTRRLLKTPAFSLTAIAVLALGVGAAVALYALVDAALVRPLPYRDPSRLIALYEHNPIGDRFHISDFDYRAWKQRNRGFASLSVYRPEFHDLNDANGPEEVSGAIVSDDFFRTLGVAPILGRDFRPGEDRPGAPKAVMLSYRAWQTRFGGSEHVLEQTVRLDGDSYLIVGVLPADFHFAPVGRAEFWTTLHGYCEQSRTCFPFYGVARLKDGVPFSTAYENISGIAHDIAAEFPQYNRGRTATMLPLPDVILGDIRPTLLALWSSAGLLLLIGFVNVSSLLLVRAENRRREIAVRGALGASRVRLLRDFAVEAFLLAGAGCLPGFVCALGLARILRKQIPPNLLDKMPYLDNLHLNGHLVLFGLAAWILGGVLFSAGPALHFLLSDPYAGLKDGGRTAARTTWRRMGSSLVAIEMAITVVLLLGAGLLTKSFFVLMHVDLGMDADHLSVVHVSVQRNWNYVLDLQLERQVRERMLALPGTASVGIAQEPPLGSGEPFASAMAYFRVAGRPVVGQGYETLDSTVSAGYFETLRARLIRGRLFTDADDATKPRVAVINRSMAAQVFSGEDPLGKIIISVFDPEHPQEIVGVVDDIKDGPLDMQATPAVYTPFSQHPRGDFYVTRRSVQAGGVALSAMAKAIHEMDPSLIVNEEETMTDRIANSESAYMHRSAAWVIGGFAGLALLLGTVGLYGVVSYSVGQRTREIGIRVALGARRGTVYALVFKESAWPVILGATGGVLSSVWVAVFLRSILFGVKSWDMETVFAVVGLLLAATLFASYFPARRAASVDPMEALRAE